MNKTQLSVIYRLPQHYRWLPDMVGKAVEPVPFFTHDNNQLLGLKLLSHQGVEAWLILRRLSQSLLEIQIPSSVIEWQNEACLYVAVHDESAAMCHLKNAGVAIAEGFTADTLW